MSRFIAVVLVLATQVCLAQASPSASVGQPVEQPVEGFARGISAQRQAPYWSHRGFEVMSSYEYARDGTQTVVWETAAVPTEYIDGIVTFVWSCGLARQQEAHALYLNDDMMLEFNTGMITEPTSWQTRDVSLRFEPIMKDGNGEVHGLMYLRVPAAMVTPGEPARLKVRGSEGEGSWYMVHHLQDSYAKSPLLELASGRRMVMAPTRSVFRSVGRITWHCFLALGEQANLPGDTVQLRARLHTDTDELSLERKISIEPDQRHVQLELWSAANVPVGTWQIDLAFSQDGVALQGWQGEITIEDLHELELRADWPSGSLAGSLRPALQAAGFSWSRDFLRGHLGSAFAFSMQNNGGPLWQDGYDERLLYPQIAERLEHTMLDSTQQAEAWNTVRRAIDEGYPAVVRMRTTGNHSLPGRWSVIVGYDDSMQTYTINHAGYGSYTARRDGFNAASLPYWTRIMIFRPQAVSPDAVDTGRRAIQDAIESSEGKHPGPDAAAHGLAAWEMWLDAFEQGTVDLQACVGHTYFLQGARRAAATYLRQIEPDLPSDAKSPLLAAAAHYERIASDIAALRELCQGEDADLQRGADLLSGALDAERAALASLRQVLKAL